MAYFVDCCPLPLFPSFLVHVQLAVSHYHRLDIIRLVWHRPCGWREEKSVQRSDQTRHECSSTFYPCWIMHLFTHAPCCNRWGLLDHCLPIVFDAAWLVLVVLFVVDLIVFVSCLSLALLLSLIGADVVLFDLFILVHLCLIWSLMRCSVSFCSCTLCSVLLCLFACLFIWCWLYVQSYTADLYRMDYGSGQWVVANATAIPWSARAGHFMKQVNGYLILGQYSYQSAQVDRVTKHSTNGTVVSYSDICVCAHWHGYAVCDFPSFSSVRV